VVGNGKGYIKQTNYPPPAF